MQRLPLLLALAALAVPAALAQPVQNLSGTLAAGDPTREGGMRYDAHAITAREGQMVKVRMTSDAFDTYLVVKGPNGEEHTNDDFEGTRVSQVEFVASTGGAWTVWASAFTGEAEGAYTVEVTPGAIATVELTEGRLDPRDKQLPKGEFYDLVERAFRSGVPFTVELKSYGFDGYLVLESPTGKMYRNDDDGDAATSRLRDVAPEPGTWKIYVTTTGADAMGAYDLRVITFPAR